MESEPQREQALGRVTEDLEIPRGPDVSFEIAVPAEWIARGEMLVIAWPRRATCRACGGGGCDACGRSGAFTLQRASSEEPLEVKLPALDPSPPLLTIRLPSLGMPSGTSERPNGHLFLEVRAADRPSPGVARARVSEAGGLGRGVMRTSLLVAVGLSLLFVFLLRLSGWL